MSHAPARPARPRARAPAPAKDAPTRSQRILELVEELEGRFDEAVAHVASRPEFGNYRLMPVRMLASDRLLPGTIGWLREVRHTTQPRRRDDALETLAGWLYYVVCPAPVAPEPDGPVSPLLGTTEESFAFAEWMAGVPRTFLAARVEGEVDLPLLRRLTEEVRRELESDE